MEHSPTPRNILTRLRKGFAKGQKKKRHAESFLHASKFFFFPAHLGFYFFDPFYCFCRRRKYYLPHTFVFLKFQVRGISGFCKSCGLILHSSRFIQTSILQGREGVKLKKVLFILIHRHACVCINFLHHQLSKPKRTLVFAA
jgi:hypothetical protein